MMESGSLNMCGRTMHFSLSSVQLLFLQMPLNCSNGDVCGGGFSSLTNGPSGAKPYYNVCHLTFYYACKVNGVVS